MFTYYQSIRAQELCVKVVVAVLGSPSLMVRTVCVCVCEIEISPPFLQSLLEVSLTIVSLVASRLSLPSFK